ncbi:histidinol dehydrogenase, partial [Halolamina salina]
MQPRAIAELSTGERRAFFDRDSGVESAREDVREILPRVREEGDVAVREFSKEFDDVDVANIDVTAEAERAVEDVDDDTLELIRDAVEKIRAFHERQRPDDWREQFEDREL